jgi:cell division protein FtsA
MLTTGMDCRIGTPNEHLAGADDELKNPMYATGVGLVMKGIEKYEREAKRGLNSSKPNEEKVLVSATPETKKKEEKKVIGHSTKKVGNFFDSLITKAKDWMSDDVE